MSLPRQFWKEAKLNPEMRSRLLVIASYPYAQRVTGVAGVAGREADEIAPISSATRATAATPPESSPSELVGSDAALPLANEAASEIVAERAAIIEVDGGLPHEIAIGLARLEF